jgi:hypothetical protein
MPQPISALEQLPELLPLFPQEPNWKLARTIANIVVWQFQRPIREAEALMMPFVSGPSEAARRESIRVICLQDPTKDSKGSPRGPNAKVALLGSIVWELQNEKPNKNPEFVRLMAEWKGRPRADPEYPRKFDEYAFLDDPEDIPGPSVKRGNDA